MNKNNKKIPSSLRLQVYMRDGFTCTYCNKIIINHHDVSIDHVLPKAHGGKDHLNNLTVSCIKCNEDKGKMLLTQYIRGFEIKLTKRIIKWL